VWRTCLAGDLAGALAGGDHPPVRDFLVRVGAVAVPFPDSRPFANVNRPEDLARLAAALAQSPAEADPGAGPATQGR